MSAHTRAMALDAGADPARTARIPNGVDLRRPPAPSGAACRCVLTVGRLRRRYKGHDVMLARLPAIRARVPGTRVGWWSATARCARELEPAVAAAGLDEAVSFAGAVVGRGA